MNNWERIFKKVGLLAFCLTASVADAATVQVTGSVTRFLIQPGQFGGCMIQTSANLTDAGLVGCSTFNWISLDCEATKGGSKASNSKMLELAQLAYVLDKQVRVNVTDYNRVAGNQCRANRLDLQ